MKRENLYRRFLWPFVILAFVNLGAAFMSEIQVLDKKEIVKLSDEKLVDTYLDVLVEIEAVRTFHTTSGFTPKDYRSFKDLIRYRLLLIMELKKRNVELPDFGK